jgi:triosephosphate isomerase
MRSKIVAGNWKMNKTLDEGVALASEIVNMVNDAVLTDVKTVICPPFIHLNSVSKIIGGNPKVVLGAQNCNDHESGAYTGEVSVGMLKSVGVQYVIIGHSERREYYNENNAFLKDKVDAALKADLVPIFCCGEPLEVRESEEHFSYVTNQLTESLFHLEEQDFAKLVIAYEPIWAIGTGKTATEQQAQEMHKKIRDHIASRYSEAMASEISILYGGSCKPSNAKELFAQPDVDGGLIGGAALKSKDFVDIIKSF